MVKIWYGEGWRGTYIVLFGVVVNGEFDFARGARVQGRQKEVGVEELAAVGVAATVQPVRVNKGIAPAKGTWHARTWLGNTLVSTSSSVRATKGSQLGNEL